MSDSALMQSEQHMVSEMAETLIGSEIIKLAAEINEKFETAKGSTIIRSAILTQRFFLFHLS